MDRLPPELKLRLLELAASSDLRVLLSLSGVDPTFHGLYKHNEERLLYEFANDYIQPQVRILCFSLSLLPTADFETGHAFSDWCDEAECTNDCEEIWEDAKQKDEKIAFIIRKARNIEPGDSAIPVETLTGFTAQPFKALKAMIKAQAMAIAVRELVSFRQSLGYPNKPTKPQERFYYKSTGINYSTYDRAETGFLITQSGNHIDIFVDLYALLLTCSTYKYDFQYTGRQVDNIVCDVIGFDHEDEDYDPRATEDLINNSFEILLGAGSRLYTNPDFLKWNFELCKSIISAPEFPYRVRKPRTFIENFTSWNTAYSCAPGAPMLELLDPTAIFRLCLEENQEERMRLYLKMVLTSDMKYLWPDFVDL